MINAINKNQIFSLNGVTSKSPLEQKQEIKYIHDLQKKCFFNYICVCEILIIHFFLMMFFRYNNLNIDQILSSDRLVTNYVECLLSRKPCPPEGKDLKRKFNMVIENILMRAS